MYFSVFCVVSIMVNSALASKVCFGELGCFSDDWPFTSDLRPHSSPPWGPAQLQTKFSLFTRANRRRSQSLIYNYKDSIINSNIDRSEKTKIIIHGFITEEYNWALDLKEYILSVENTNVIVVDWSEGSNKNLLYSQACANARVVGAQIAELFMTIRSVTAASASTFHLIGQRLGVHVAGYAGERLLQKENIALGRITGLDPVGPYFEGTPAEVRLDPTDARYVDVIHTDGIPGGWGMIEPVGHVDFYPNGGKNQPGCGVREIDFGLWWEMSCNSARAYTLMIDSIRNVDFPMNGYLCTDYETFKTGACSACPGGRCPTLGYYSDRVRNSYGVNVKYYLTTGSSPPYANCN